MAIQDIHFFLLQASPELHQIHPGQLNASVALKEVVVDFSDLNCHFLGFRQRQFSVGHPSPAFGQGHGLRVLWFPLAFDQKGPGLLCQGWHRCDVGQGPGVLVQASENAQKERLPEGSEERGAQVLGGISTGGGGSEPGDVVLLGVWLAAFFLGGSLAVFFLGIFSKSAKTRSLRRATLKNALACSMSLLTS